MFSSDRHRAEERAPLEHDAERGESASSPAGPPPPRRSRPSTGSLEADEVAAGASTCREPLPPRMVKISPRRDLKVMSSRSVTSPQPIVRPVDGRAVGLRIARHDAWKRKVKHASSMTIAKSDRDDRAPSFCRPTPSGPPRRREPLLARDEADRDREGDAHDQAPTRCPRGERPAHLVEVPRDREIRGS